MHLLGDACSLQQSVVWKDLFRDWHIQIHQPNTVGSCRVLARLQKAVGLHYCSAVSTVISCRVLLVLQSSSRCFGVLRLLYVGSALLLCWQHPHCSPLPKRNLSVTKVKGESCSGIWLLILPHDRTLCGAVVSALIYLSFGLLAHSAVEANSNILHLKVGKFRSGSSPGYLY